jgi:cytochrome c peroxidase
MMSTLRPRLTALLAIVSLGAVVGCGGGTRSDAEQRPMADAGSDTGGGPELTDPTGFLTPDELRELEEFEPLGPPPPDPTNEYADSERAAHFGQFLFYDTRLSGNGEVSCATCHQPDHGFADPDRLSTGIGQTTRHAPTLLNVSYNRWYFWDGRADSTWAQTHTPLEHPDEQGISRVEIAHVLHDDDELRSAYEQIFGDLPDLSDESRFPDEGRPVPGNPDHPEHQKWQSMSEEDRRAIDRVMANVGKAIGAFERRLVSRDAPFDAFIRGLQEGDTEDINRLDDSARRGLRLFIGKANCNECHTGPFFSDLEFHNLGLPPRGWLPSRDLGRYAGVSIVKEDRFNAAGPFSDAPESTAADEIEFLAQKAENRGQFKTPTLRNVERTPPYMHGGHFETLEEVVEFYAELDGRATVGHREESLEPFELTESEKDDLVAFLESLNGEPVPEALESQPDSPLPNE